MKTNQETESAFDDKEQEKEGWLSRLQRIPLKEIGYVSLCTLAVIFMPSKNK